ncbi:MAG: hypothetical protein HKN16_12715 [Saprospiraceae bacterium]|nr:hypothetical protein [Saprospiraceae bacterium]
MHPIQDTVDRLKNEGFDVGISQNLDQAWKIFKINGFAFIGFTIIAFLVASMGQMIPFIGILVSSIVLSPLLNVGYALVADRINKGEANVPFEGFFQGFQHARQLIPQAAIIFGVYMVIFIPFGIWIWTSGLFEFFSEVMLDPTKVEDLEEPPLTMVWFILGMMPFLLYIGLIFMFAPYFVVFHQCDFMEGLKFSFQIINKRFWAFFGAILLLIFAFLFVTGLFVFLAVKLGVIFAVIGFLAVMALILIFSPFAQIFIYTWFENIVGTKKEGESDQIESHLVN